MDNNEITGTYVRFYRRGAELDMFLALIGGLLEVDNDLSHKEWITNTIRRSIITWEDVQI